MVQTGVFVRRYWCFADPPVIIDGVLRGKSVRMVGIENWLSDAIVADSTAQQSANMLAQVAGKLLGIVEREDLGHLRSTAGGQSLQAYRHLHLPGKILCHGHADALRLERSAALGWPPVLHRAGAINETVHVLDCNALFPHVMASYPHPRKLLWHSEHMTVNDLKVAGETALLIARVKVKDWNRTYLVQEHDKCKLMRGDFSGTLVGPDLDAALSRGAVLHVWEAAGYEGAGMFCEWADWVWDMRQRYKVAGDGVGAHVAKMLGVALWGSFAARLQRYVAEPNIPAPQPYGEFFYHPTPPSPRVKCRAIAGVVDRLEERVEPNDSIPSISAFVAVYARIYMDGMRAFAGDYNVIAQVADALHVTQAGLDNLTKAGLVDPERRGALKLVRSAHRSVYLAANTVIHDGELTAAGIHTAAEQVRPGVFRWRLPSRLSRSIVQAPTGQIEAPEVERSLPGQS
jgi:DNA polymerase type B, organellar and viral